MTHYATLGCPSDATPEQIKAVNRAFDVLSDPQRREFYDATGLDDPDAPETPASIAALVSHAAQMLLQDLFAQLLEKVESDRKLFDLARLNLQQMQEATQRELNQAQSRTKKLAARRERITVKAGHQNLITAILDKQLAQLEEAIEFCTRRLEVVAAALPLVDNYETTEPLFQEPSRSTYTASSMVTDMAMREIEKQFGIARGGR